MLKKSCPPPHSVPQPPKIVIRANFTAMESIDSLLANPTVVPNTLQGDNFVVTRDEFYGFGG